MILLWTLKLVNLLHSSKEPGFKNAPDKQAIDELSPGDAVIIFTPDSEFKGLPTFASLTSFKATYYPVALAATQRKCHVLITNLPPNDFPIISILFKLRGKTT
jgi:hypothetical protein